MWCATIRATGGDPWTPIQKCLSMFEHLEEVKRLALWKDKAAALAEKASNDLDAAKAEQAAIEREVAVMTGQIS